MTAPELAAAMERNAYTLDDGTPCRCERCAHHRDAARMLRELDKVRSAAVQYHESSHGGCDNPDVPLTCVQTEGEPLCPWCAFDAAMSTALRGVGGG